jgi:hypothetical protein
MPAKQTGQGQHRVPRGGYERPGAGSTGDDRATLERRTDGRNPSAWVQDSDNFTAASTRSGDTPPRPLIETPDLTTSAKLIGPTLVVEAVAGPADKSNMARRPSIVLAALVGVAIPAAAALAAATPVTPAPEATVTSSLPHFAWTLPTGEWSQGLYIARKPDVTPEGRFYDQNIVQVGVVVAADREWTPSVPLYAGSYWWNVWSSDPVSQVIFSTPAAFVIPVSLRLVGVKTKRYLSLHALDFEVRWTANVQRPLVRLRLLRARKIVWRASKTAYNTIGVPGSTRFSWKRPTRLKRGTRLKLLASISSSGVKRARTFIVRAP